MGDDLGLQGSTVNRFTNGFANGVVNGITHAVGELISDISFFPDLSLSIHVLCLPEMISLESMTHHDPS